MRGLKKKRRVQVIVLAGVALAVSAGLIGYGMRDGINFFRTPSEVAETPPPPGEVFRIGGLVLEGTLVSDQGPDITFTVTDGGAEIPVRYIGSTAPPDLFGEGQGTVATGTFQDGLFMATELLARHDETYMPAEVIDALEQQGVYRHAEDEGA
ncbi:cytochrome c maturation protein CcmE [Rhodobacteraceae bacterium W635]|uniref:cytochrome c maturation protein CcmE n=1 Tax=Nioella halotolerans TaxID=2303578 RepID=UPI000E3C6883|nr:cytochrome c maturation protein CcmE [Rhodobacteraceae bacterium W635]